MWFMYKIILINYYKIITSNRLRMVFRKLATLECIDF